MNIQNIKALVGTENGFTIEGMDFTQQLKELESDGTNLNLKGETVPKGEKYSIEEPWLSYWNNTKRVRVTMHQEIFDKLCANRSLEGLALKPAETVSPAGKAPYTRYVVIMPTGIKATF